MSERSHAEILRSLAEKLRFQASLPTPRDYVPTTDELARECAPILELAEALEAGAEALDVIDKIERA